jgi:hypothetical protein
VPNLVTRQIRFARDKLKSKSNSQNRCMSNKMSPEEVLNSIVEGINTGDLDSLTLYDDDACFASQPGQLTKSPEAVRHSLRSFIDLEGKLDLKVKRFLQASDLALVTSEWSFKGTGLQVHCPTLPSLLLHLLYPLSL